MKNTLLIFILIFISCKSDPKVETKTGNESNLEIEEIQETERGIDKTVYEMWKNYTEANPEFRDQQMPMSDYFHDNKEDADRLAELALNGKKKASSSLYFLYEQYGVDLPEVGKKQIVTDFDGKAQAIIETSRVDTIAFNKISKNYAQLDMGTDIEPLKKWKEEHLNFFKTVVPEREQKETDKMLIVCEVFDVIWTKNN